MVGRGKSIELPTDLAEWDGLCLELANHLLKKHPGGQILRVDLRNTHPHWVYHAAIVVDGIVHDAWHPDVRLPPAEYVERVFGHDVTWELNPESEDEWPLATANVVGTPPVPAASMGT